MNPTLRTGAAGVPTVSTEDAYERVRAGLLGATRLGRVEGVPGTEAHGQLIRPLVAFAGSAGAPSAAFWQGALAIQLAHEASLVHDDIVDGATRRRGAPTPVAEAGVARALLQGDHLLTAAYRAAARTGSIAFVTLFARAVERTVAWEAEQARSVGRVLERRDYEEIALGKSGELLGCALALDATLSGREEAADLFELGRRIGLVYQMLDDLLDYCPRTQQGKPALADYAQRRWTWVLGEAPDLPFGLERSELLHAVHRPGCEDSPMRRALVTLLAQASALEAHIALRFPGDLVLGPMLAGWMTRARDAIELEARGDAETDSRSGGRIARIASPEAALLRERVPRLDQVDAYLATHSRSFRFASRFFRSADAARVGRVYAYCRITDDLVDCPPHGRAPAELITAWLELSQRAYRGESSGLPLLDRVMEEMAGAGVPFDYAADLVEGMRMDLRGERYASLAELRRYTYRVASVVGLWLTRLFGVHSPTILERAERMGHAMQLTNILRDVGEDLGRGRLYLPADRLRHHAVAEADLARMRTGQPISPAYRALIEELLCVAEADYGAALAALPSLPITFARPVAVSAHVYRGIHREIRRRGYDNLRHRAHTLPIAKGIFASRALWELYTTSRARAAQVVAPTPLAEGRVE